MPAQPSAPQASQSLLIANRPARNARTKRSGQAYFLDSSFCRKFAHNMSDILLIKHSGAAFSKKQEQFNKLILSLEKRKKQLHLLETRFTDFKLRFGWELRKPMNHLSASMMTLVNRIA
jgi:hypothetical protein